MSEYVLVPKSDLKRLEEARVKLYGMYDPMTIQELIELQKITEVMWSIANTRWDEVKVHE